MLGLVVLLLVVLESVLSYPFNLDHIKQFEQLAKLNSNPYTVAAKPYNQFKPLFNPLFAQQQQQYGVQQQYGQPQPQYNPLDYLADPLGSFPVHHKYLFLN